MGIGSNFQYPKKPKRIDIKNAKNIAKKIVSSFLAVSFGKLIEGLIPIGPRLFLV